ncbi:hypothetical protein SAMN06265365_111143 [Tistlia consotensis]|uniref:Uncharacterized protein n=1 Tax=Tistlia consotensis USBA 355 TaxID=560819 RepID=A0A1Y6C3A5_9PROT|nr:hypothetical protein [Tistlia consotensis]SMF33675.1 hypothetical protein SAMN05428998_111145 [Tistlia consotensis USBA 355]SNR70103.1 hypothetical protein SAMN06265365_111143 [Tistlia consotensis]
MIFPGQLGPICRFLEDLGLDCGPGAVPPDSFLPGVAIAEGRLLYDSERLGSPGDLLHEAGHIALVPARFRGQLDDDVDAVIAGLLAGEGEAPPDAAEREALAHTEVMAIAWSYAAARRIGVPATCLFWPGTYRMPPGQTPDQLAGQLEQGLFIGIQWLARFGFCAAPPPFGDPAAPDPFPAMRRWLAD